MNRAEFTSVTALVPSGGSLPDAIKFFVDNMGFELMWEGGGMVGVRRGLVSFNLIENNNREWLDNSSYSIGVSDLDALYEEYQGIDTKMTPPEVKFWGRREFHMIVPSGVCLQFYQAP